MTFDDYWMNNWAPSSMPMAFDLAMREIAKKAWNAAIATEREACAKVCEEQNDTKALKITEAEESWSSCTFVCADAIRMRSNP